MVNSDLKPLTLPINITIYVGSQCLILYLKVLKYSKHFEQKIFIRISLQDQANNRIHQLFDQNNQSGMKMQSCTTFSSSKR